MHYKHLLNGPLMYVSLNSSCQQHHLISNFVVDGCEQMTDQHLARVIFLTDSALEDGVAKANPNIKTESITLSDASHESGTYLLFYPTHVHASHLNP
jgi:hypothetical protein